MVGMDTDTVTVPPATAGSVMPGELLTRWLVADQLAALAGALKYPEFAARFTELGDRRHPSIAAAGTAAMSFSRRVITDSDTPGLRASGRALAEEAGWSTAAELTENPFAGRLVADAAGVAAAALPILPRLEAVVSARSQLDRLLG